MDDSHATTQQNDTSDIAPTNEVQQVTAADAASTIDSTASQSTAEHPSATFEPCELARLRSSPQDSTLMRLVQLSLRLQPNLLQRSPSRRPSTTQLHRTNEFTQLRTYRKRPNHLQSRRRALHPLRRPTMQRSNHLLPNRSMLLRPMSLLRSSQRAKRSPMSPLRLIRKLRRRRTSSRPQPARREERLPLLCLKVRPVNRLSCCRARSSIERLPLHRLLLVPPRPARSSRAISVPTRNLWRSAPPPPPLLTQSWFRLTCRTELVRTPRRLPMLPSSLLPPRWVR